MHSNYKRDSSWVTQDVKLFKSLLFEIIELGHRNPNNELINIIIVDIKAKYDTLIKSAKSDYYADIIKSSKNPSKTMWNVVNKERGKNNTPNLDVTDVVINTDGTKFASKKDMVNAMNARFLRAAVTCGAPRATLKVAMTELCGARPPADCSLRLQPFSEDEVHRLITTLIPPKASKDVYGISMQLLRYVSAPLSNVLADLFNRCIKEGNYPTALKISRVAPIYKGKGKRADLDGYRPVSIIPAIGKVFENGLSSRLVAFLSSTNALSDRQYAYRAGRSTTSLTRELVRRILSAREGSQQVAIICCDLSKAFDVADHTLLAAKLRHYGIDGTSHALFTSLLKDRSQIVVGDRGKERSDPLRSTMGVVQGSSVSNLLFSLLLNDLPDSVTTAYTLMYADDIAAVVTAASVDCLEQKLNETASQLARWFHANGLALNLNKTLFLQFDLSGHRRRPLTVQVDSTALTEVKMTTFLGFDIDSGLKWDSHIDKLSSRISSACFALGRVARTVPAEVARSCYFATVHSLIQYGAEIWGRCAEWERVFRLQKRAVRAIARVPCDASARPFFKSLRIPTLPSIVILQVAVYVRTNLESFATRSSGHTYNTRNAKKLGEISRKLTKSSKLTHIMGPTIYNKLPEHVTGAPSLSSFKYRLQRWLVEHSFYSYEEFVKLK